MDRAHRLLHRSSFGAAADAYGQHRPDYAQAAVRWALEPARGPRVLDLGAGTGKLTATLVALGADVIAVEPDPAMLMELRRVLPAVHALPGSAEAVPLPDASVDAVLAGNALHWFDMDAAGPEIARVLVPDGILAGLWNVMDNRVDWVAGLERVSGSAAIGPRDRLSSWRGETAGAYLPSDGLVAHFGSPESVRWRNARISIGSATSAAPAASSSRSPNSSAEPAASAASPAVQYARGWARTPDRRVGSPLWRARSLAVMSPRAEAS